MIRFTSHLKFIDAILYFNSSNRKVGYNDEIYIIIVDYVFSTIRLCLPFVYQFSEVSHENRE